MVPLVGSLVFINYKRSFKVVGIWLIPVILIPMIWPVYAIATGHSNAWLSGVFYQTHRERIFFASLYLFSKDDPVLFILGAASLVIAGVRRDYFILLWAVPFLIFLYFTGWVLIYHLIPLLPAFCIAAAILFVKIVDRVRFKTIARISLTTAVSGILVFGIVTTSVLITRDVNSNYFEGASFVSQYLENNDVSFKKNNLTLISDAFYLWIPQHVFHLPGIYKTYFDNTLSNNQMSVLIVDPGFIKVMLEHSKQGNLLHSLYNSNNTRNIATFRENQSNQNMSIYLFEPKAVKRII